MRFVLTFFAACLALSACQAQTPASGALPETDITDARYKGLVFLVASVRHAGGGFVVTNDSTQPWFDVTLTLAGAGNDDYHLHLDEIDAGQSVTAAPGQFATSSGLRFNPQRVMPRTLIVSAEIGEGGPTGVYAARL